MGKYFISKLKHVCQGKGQIKYFKCLQLIKICANIFIKTSVSTFKNFFFSILSIEADVETRRRAVMMTQLHSLVSNLLELMF